MIMLWGGCGKITRQLGNIENNTIFFFKKLFLNLICHYGSRLRDFWYEAQKNAKKTREIEVFKARTTRRFGGISNCYTSRKIFGCNILSTWRLSGSHDAYSPVLATGTNKFMIRWQRTSAAPFRLLHMQNGW